MECPDSKRNGGAERLIRPLIPFLALGVPLSPADPDTVAPLSPVHVNVVPHETVSNAPNAEGIKNLIGSSATQYVLRLDGTDNAYMPFRSSLPDIAAAFEAADERLRYETVGKSKIVVKKIFSGKAQPTGWGAYGSLRAGKCYSLEDMKTVSEKTRKQKNIPSSSLLHIVLTQKPSCLNGAAAYAAVGSKDKFNVYNPGYASGENGAGIIIHEYGHQRGLPHTADLVCKDKNITKKIGDELVTVTKKANAQIEGFRDFAERGCGHKKKPITGDPYLYADNMVMGAMLPAIDFSPFSYKDLHGLNPERFTYRTIPAEKGQYELSGKQGGLYGLELKLPDNDPLKQIDPTIGRLGFGLGRMNSWLKPDPTLINNTIDTYAIAEDINYTIPPSIEFPTRMGDMEGYASVTVVDGLDLLVVKKIMSDKSKMFDARLFVEIVPKGDPMYEVYLKAQKNTSD